MSVLILHSYHAHQSIQSHHYGQMQPFQTYGRTCWVDLSKYRLKGHKLRMYCVQVGLTMNRLLPNLQMHTIYHGIQPMGKQIVCRTYSPIQSRFLLLCRIRVIDL